MIMTAILVAMIIAKCRAKDALVQGKTSGNNPVKHNTIRIGDLDISYRESGPLDAPVILLMQVIHLRHLCFGISFPY